MILLTEDQEAELIQAASDVVRDDLHFASVPVEDRATSGLGLAEIILRLFQAEPVCCPDDCPLCQIQEEST